MKILAATPSKNYGETTYIAELKSSELSGILAIGSYDEISASDVHDNKVSRKPNELVAGDTIEPTTITFAAGEIRSLRSQKAEMDKAFSTLRGAITKVQNIILPNQ